MYNKASNESAAAIEVRKWWIFCQHGNNAINGEVCSYILFTSIFPFIQRHLTARTISVLIWPLFTTIVMRYRCYVTREPHSFQSEKNLLAVASLCPIEDYWVSSKRLLMMAYGEQRPLFNWGKDLSPMRAMFQSKLTQNCYKPFKIEFVRVKIAHTGRLINSMSSSNMSIASSILTRS